jgi:hypothetical protein
VDKNAFPRKTCQKKAQRKDIKKHPKRKLTKIPVWIATMGLLCFNVTISNVPEAVTG